MQKSKMILDKKSDLITTIEEDADIENLSADSDEEVEVCDSFNNALT